MLLTREEITEIQTAKDVMINAISPNGTTWVDWDWKTPDGSYKR